MTDLPSVPAKPQGLPFAGVGAAALTRASAKGGRDTRPPAIPLPGQHPSLERNDGDG
jgi:hypothetical protein